MVIGVYTLEFHLPASRSLKDKRQVTRRLKDRLRARHNLSLVESEQFADLWQRGDLIIVSVATQRDALARLFEAVHREACAHVPGTVIEVGEDYIDGAEVT